MKAPPVRSTEIRGAGCQGKLQIDSRAPHTSAVWICRRWKELQLPEAPGSIIHRVTAAPCNSCREWDGCGEWLDPSPWLRALLSCRDHAAQEDEWKLGMAETQE